MSLLEWLHVCFERLPGYTRGSAYADIAKLEPLELLMAWRTDQIAGWDPPGQAMATVRLLKLHGEDPQAWSAQDAKRWLETKGG